ncbi:pumilio homolog 12-like [Humulus lupulus]|uniref:pumilio homolog 12-like n=1 Tax=Humulus lupulus TaxID=3486 RepID=UPI002B41792B|nr:pumilio homolog 12-like [Humulus lupulus]
MVDDDHGSYHSWERPSWFRQVDFRETTQSPSDFGSIENQTLEAFSGLNVGSNITDLRRLLFRQSKRSPSIENGGGLGYGLEGDPVNSFLRNGMAPSSRPILSTGSFFSTTSENYPNSDVNSSPSNQIGVIPSSNSNDSLSDDSFGFENGTAVGQSQFHISSWFNILGNSLVYWRDEDAVEFVRGRVAFMSKDQSDYKIIQGMLQNRKKSLNVIFSEVLEDISNLVIDPFGNYVVQSLVALCSEEQRTKILYVLTGLKYQFFGVCINMHGTRVVQKLLDHLSYKFQRLTFLKAIYPFVVHLTKCANGYHVIQQCIRNFDSKEKECLLTQVLNHCVEIAMDKFGCCVLQFCVEHTEGEIIWRLVAEILLKALLLAEDRYGNYVVQHLLGLKIPVVTEHIMRQLKGSYVSLSLSKYGSNVVERCLKECEETQAMKVVMEMLQNQNISMLFLDPYGNYVIQSALLVSKGQVRKALLSLIDKHANKMRCHQYGKKILDLIEKRKLRNHNTKNMYN